jgi:periplasmic protein CpxP/Spy
MMRRRISTMVVALGIAAAGAATVVHGQAAQDAPGTPKVRHGRPGSGGPGGPGGPGGFFRGRGGPGGPGFGGAMGLLRGLDLTDEQRTKVRELMDGNREALEAIGDRLVAAHRAQNEAVTASPYDEQAIRAKAADVAAVMADAAVLHAKIHSEVFALLTPEQQAKAAELKAQRQARVDQVRERVQERRGRRQAPRQTPPQQ